MDDLEKSLRNFIVTNKMADEKPKVIYRGQRGQQFRDMIGRLLINSQLKPKYIDILLDEYSISIYDIVFTHKSANSYNNYEFYELLGDKTVNKSIAWYLSRRFPELIKNLGGVEIMTKLITNLQSKKSLSAISSSLDFWKFITADETFRNTKKTNMLEDVFEAFIGATEYLIDERVSQGAGYSISYNIMKSILDQDNTISTEWEYVTDPITRLQETFNSGELRARSIGVLNPYEERQIQDPTGMKKWSVTISRRIGDKSEELGTGIDSTKPLAKKKAAVMALQTLAARGFVYTKKIE